MKMGYNRLLGQWTDDEGLKGPDKSIKGLWAFTDLFLLSGR